MAKKIFAPESAPSILVGWCTKQTGVSKEFFPYQGFLAMYLGKTKDLCIIAEIENLLKARRFSFSFSSFWNSPFPEWLTAIGGPEALVIKDDGLNTDPAKRLYGGLGESFLHASKYSTYISAIHDSDWAATFASMYATFLSTIPSEPQEGRFTKRNDLATTIKAEATKVSLYDNLINTFSEDSIEDALHTAVGNHATAVLPTYNGVPLYSGREIPQQQGNPLWVRLHPFLTRRNSVGDYITICSLNPIMDVPQLPDIYRYTIDDELGDIFTVGEKTLLVSYRSYVSLHCVSVRTQDLIEKRNTTFGVSFANPDVPTPSAVEGAKREALFSFDSTVVNGDFTYKHKPPQFTDLGLELPAGNALFDVLAIYNTYGGDASFTPDEMPRIYPLETTPQHADYVPNSVMVKLERTYITKTIIPGGFILEGGLLYFVDFAPIGDHSAESLFDEGSYDTNFNISQLHYIPIIDHFSLENIYPTSYHWATLLGGAIFAMTPSATQRISTTGLASWTEGTGLLSSIQRQKGFPTSIIQPQYNRSIYITHVVLDLYRQIDHVQTNDGQGNTSLTKTFTQSKTVEEWTSKKIDFDGDNLTIVDAETKPVTISANAYSDRVFKRSDTPDATTSAINAVLNISGVAYDVEYKKAPTSPAETLFSVNIPAMSISSNQEASLAHAGFVGLMSSNFPKPFSMPGTIYTPGVMKDPSNIFAGHAEGFDVYSRISTIFKRFFSLIGDHLFQDIEGSLYRGNEYLFTPEASITPSLGDVLSYSNAVVQNTSLAAPVNHLYLWGKASYSNTHQFFTENLADIGPGNNVTSHEEILSGSGFNIAEEFPIATIQDAGNSFISNTRLAYVAYNIAQIGFYAGTDFSGEIEDVIFAIPSQSEAVSFLTVKDPLHPSPEENQPLFYTSNRGPLPHKELYTMSSYIGAPNALTSLFAVYTPPLFGVEVMDEAILQYKGAYFIETDTSLSSVYQVPATNITASTQITNELVSYGSYPGRFIFNEFLSPKTLPLLTNDIEDYMDDVALNTVDLIATSGVFDGFYYNV